MNEHEIMLTSVLDCRRADLAFQKDKLTSKQQSDYNDMRARRAQDEPLQYIIGQWDFCGIPLIVDRRALVPRPETEILVDLAVNKAKALASEKQTFNILDLGVGSGNITLALLKNLSNANVTAVDISPEALALARENVKKHDLDHRVHFLCADMMEYLKDAAGQKKTFDMVISNPPYIPTSQMSTLPADVQQEPSVALDGGADGLEFYRSIIKYGRRILTVEGLLALEIGDDQRVGIEAIFHQHSYYRDITFYKDYVGTERIVMAHPAESVRGI